MCLSKPLVLDPQCARPPPSVPYRYRKRFFRAVKAKFLALFANLNMKLPHGDGAMLKQLWHELMGKVYSGALQGPVPIYADDGVRMLINIRNNPSRRMKRVRPESSERRLTLLDLLLLLDEYTKDQGYTNMVVAKYVIVPTGLQRENRKLWKARCQESDDSEAEELTPESKFSSWALKSVAAAGNEREAPPPPPHRT